MKKNHELPTKLSALIKVALKDLKKVEKDKNYKVNLSMWHQTFDDDVCYVCLAGAVLAKSLKIDRKASICRRNGGFLMIFNEQFIKKELPVPQMLALDDVAVGGVGHAVRALRHAFMNDKPMSQKQLTVVDRLDSVVFYHEYEEYPVLFKKNLKIIASKLDEVGL